MQVQIPLDILEWLLTIPHAVYRTFRKQGDRADCKLKEK